MASANISQRNRGDATQPISWYHRSGYFYQTTLPFKALYGNREALVLKRSKLYGHAEVRITTQESTLDVPLNQIRPLGENQLTASLINNDALFVKQSSAKTSFFETAFTHWSIVRTEPKV